MSAQLKPVDAHPDIAVLLVGALLWSTPADAAAVLALVRDDDLSDPALAAVLAAVRTLSATGRTLGPQLVLDELRRTGTSAAMYQTVYAKRLRQARPL